MTGLDPSALRRLNTSVVLRALASAAEPLGLAGLAERSGLSRRTVDLILETLLEAGWVTELERVPTTGEAGRPPRRFELRAEHSLLCAVRITTLDASVVVADVRGRVLSRARRALPDYFDPRSTIDLAAQLVREALDEGGLSAERLRAGAIASGGAIDERGVIRRLVHADNWLGIDLPAEFAARIDVPWFADNDANLGALAERWRGSAQDHDDVVWAILGQRAGLGILIRGVVHRGLAGAAGEIVEAPPIGAEKLDHLQASWLTSPVPKERLIALERFAAARAGDLEARAEVETVITHIVNVLTTLSWTIAPSLIVLGGGLEVAADVLIPRLRDELRAARAPDVELRATSLGGEAPLIGALKFALDRMDTELLGPVVSES